MAHFVSAWNVKLRIMNRMAWRLDMCASTSLLTWTILIQKCVYCICNSILTHSIGSVCMYINSTMIQRNECQYLVLSIVFRFKAFFVFDEWKSGIYAAMSRISLQHKCWALNSGFQLNTHIFAGVCTLFVAFVRFGSIQCRLDIMNISTDDIINLNA